MKNAPRGHSAVHVLSTFIKLPFVFKTLVLSIFEWLLKTGFTVPTRWDVTLLVRWYGRSGDISLFLLLWRPVSQLPPTSVCNKYWLYLLFESLLNVHVNQIWSLQEVLYVFILSAIVMVLVDFFKIAAKVVVMFSAVPL